MVRNSLLSGTAFRYQSRDIKITFKEDLDTFEAYLLLKEKREKEGNKQ